MKLFTKVMLLVLVLGLVGPFIIKRPDGRPWMNTNDILPDFSSLRARVENSWSRLTGAAENMTDDLDLPSGKTKVYRWQASDGSWVFSDAPPPDSKSEEMWVDPNANVIQSTGLSTQQHSEENENTINPVAEKEAANPAGNGIPLPLTITPKQVSKLIQDAKDVQQQVNDRNRELEKITSESR